MQFNFDEECDGYWKEERDDDVGGVGKHMVNLNDKGYRQRLRFSNPARGGHKTKGENVDVVRPEFRERMTLKE